MTAAPPGLLLYQFVRPSPRLAPFISQFRTLRGRVPPPPTRSYPDGTIDLILSFGGEVRHSPQGGGHLDASPTRLWVVGPDTRTDHYWFDGPVDLLNASVRPGAGLALFGVSPTELRGRRVALDQLWPPWAVARLAELAGLAVPERIRELEAVVLRLIDERRLPSPALGRALGLVAAHHGRLPIGALAADVGLSVSSLARGFQEHVGVSPKELSRLARLWRVLDGMRAGQVSLAALAVEAGYFDQAHLSNDLVDLTGLTPATLLRSNRAEGFFQDEGQPLC